MRWWIGLALLVTACGGSPTSPGPSAPPATFTGTVTNTVTGAPVGGFTATLNGSRVTVSAPGYLTRETTNAGTVDLIPDRAPFDLTFYRQFARNALDGGTFLPLQVLAASPSIYLQRSGLSDANVTALEQAARSVIPALTGGRLQVAKWEAGDAARQDAQDWITVELVPLDPQYCGYTSRIGGPFGHIKMSAEPRCLKNGGLIPLVLAHELGHALGFGHVSTPGALMRAATLSERAANDVSVSEIERVHGAIAYHRSAGNRDIDSD